jgi:beta-barrel assembly-enhancing protease
MFGRSESRRAAAGILLAFAALSAGAALAQTPVKSGFNVFPVEQDIEVGRQSAAQAERQLPLLASSSADAYVGRIGRRLAAAAPGPEFPYSFRVVNASDVNAFALPGGPTYVTRGLIETVRTEGELAGVIAHEISHVALRHGTNQVSKAYLAQAGIGLLGGLLGGGGTTGQIIQAVGGFGLNALFLKFSRTAESQADVLGTQIMARAGYDPLAMASMFSLLKAQQGREPGKLAQFFSDHPSPVNREARVREEARLLGARRTTAPVGAIENVQADLRRMPRAASMAQIARGGGTSGPTAGGAIERPSARYRTFRHRSGFFEIDYPDNWRVVEPSSGYGVTILPEGGAVRASSGQDALVYGVVINHYEPFDGSIGDVWGSRTGPATGEGTLEQATNDLVNELTRSNSHLRASGSMRRQTVDQARALSIVLAGTSPVTRAEERVTVFTRELPDGHVIYALFVAPGRDYPALADTFQRMISSLRVKDTAYHREQ